MGHPEPIRWAAPAPVADDLRPAAESAASRWRSRAVDWGRHAALLFFSCTAACGAGELVVRLSAPQQLIIKRPDIWRPADALGWVHRPNVRGLINTGERTVHVVTDRDGFRVGRAGRAPAARHILLLGDSFMEALQVEYEQSVGGLVEARLSGRLEGGVEVVNTGVGGWDPPQYLLQARALLSHRPFDLVVVSLYLGNDVVPRGRDWFPPRAVAEVHTLRFPSQPTWREFVDAVLYPLHDYLEVRSQLFVFLKQRLHRLRIRLGLSSSEVPPVLRRSEATSPRWDVTADLCREIAAVATRAGARTLFVLVPMPYQVNTAAFSEFVREFHLDSAELDLDQPTQLMHAALQQRHLDVLDPLPVFRAADQAGSRLYGSVDNHLSPAGHDLLEHFIEPTVFSYLERAPRRRAPSPHPG